MIRVKQILIDLLPTTAKMEQEIGYTKFHLAAVLIDNGFIAYDRLSLCDEIHAHFRLWCLQDVASQLFLLEMDHYHSQLSIFCDILADLGLKDVLKHCVKFLHIEDDDEETIAWTRMGEDEEEEEGDNDISWSSAEEYEMLMMMEEPTPDVSEVTFDDGDLNLPLWKLNGFYKDNAAQAESFRLDLQRKSFAMFHGGESSPGKGVPAATSSSGPPSMPRRSTDSVQEINLCLPPLQPSMYESLAQSPKKPQRRRSLDNTSEESSPSSSKSSSLTTDCTDELSSSNSNSYSRDPQPSFTAFPSSGTTNPTSAIPKKSFVSSSSCGGGGAGGGGVNGTSADKKAQRTFPSRQDSFYNFANYYHNNPSDWKWKGTAGVMNSRGSGKSKSTTGKATQES